MIQNLHMFLVSNFSLLLSPTFCLWRGAGIFFQNETNILLFVKNLKSNWNLKWTNIQPQTLSVLLTAHSWGSF